MTLIFAATLRVSKVNVAAISPTTDDKKHNFFTCTCVFNLFPFFVLLILHFRHVTTHNIIGLVRDLNWSWLNCFEQNPNAAVNDAIKKSKHVLLVLNE